MNLQKTNFYNKILNNFKESTALSLLPSFISTKKKQKFIEGKIYVCKFSNKLFFIDFGYKYEIEIFSHELNLRLPVLNSITKQCNYVKKYSSIQFNIMVFHNFFLIFKRFKWVRFSFRKSLALSAHKYTNMANL